MSDLKVICPSCKEEHSEDRNRNIIKFSKHWIELNSDDDYDLLCLWCYNSINEVDNNIFYNIDGNYNESR